MNPIDFGRIVFLSLLLMEVVILLFRFSSCYFKREFILFLLVIIFLAIKTFFSHLFFIGIGASLMLVYVTGNLIYTVSPGKLNYIWTICVGLVSVIIVVLMILNLTRTIYFSLFYLYITAILFLYPLRRLWRIFIDTRSKIFLYLFITSIVFILAKTYDIISEILQLFFIDLTLWISICLIAGLGYLIFQKGYLSYEGFVGRLEKRDRILHSVFSRIVQTEDTLLLQDRLITSGLLSAGTSHEFKNILTRIKALSQFGLSQKALKKKDEVLHAVLENTAQGIDFISRVFDRLALRIDEKPIVINVKKDISQLFKLIRISYKREMITFSVHSEENLLVYAGKGELEQVLLNLVRNAVDSLKKSDPEEKKVGINAYVQDDLVLIDIIDNGGGIPGHVSSSIFEPHFSLKESSGLGLYLVKMLVNKNHGNIEYIPIDKGAFFRLIFPLYVNRARE